jgi:hypothetical protein
MDIINRLTNIEFNDEFINKKENYLINIFNKEKKQNNKIIKNINNSAINNIKYINNANLFWFIFIMVHGIEEYNMLKKITQTETNIRYELINVIKEKKTLLKTFKLKSDEIINDLGNLKPISIDTFKALIICLNLNVCLTNKKICEILKNNDTNTYFIIENNKMYLDKLDEESIHNKFYIVKSLKKPFSNITKYKVSELQDICLKLELINLDTKIKFKKNDYYIKIQEYITL